MRFWPFGKSEKRAGAYTDAFVQQALANANVKQYSARDTAIAVNASNAAGRAFAIADITATNGMGGPMVADVVKDHIYDIARSLVLDGECLYETTTRDGRFALRRASSWDVLAGKSADERGWQYNSYTSGPGGTSARSLGSDNVLHFRQNTEAISPWRGRSPFDNDTARTLAAIENAIRNESTSPFGYVMDMPAPESEEISVKREEAIKGMRGGIFVAESSRHAQMGMESRGSYQPKRIGFDPPASLNQLREQLERSVAAAAGMPIELVSDTAASGSREGYRRWLFSTILPMARLIEREILVKTRVQLSFSFDALAAADLQARARAFANITDGKLSPEAAAKLAGFTE